MSRAARNRKVLRSGAIGFVAGLATLGVVAHGSPAQSLISETANSVRALTGDDAHRTESRAVHRDRHDAPTSEGRWLLPQQPSEQPEHPEEQWLLPQQSPEQPYVQPAPSQQPQSQAS